MVSSYATQAFWFFDGLPTGRNPGAELLALPYPECQWAYQDTETGERRGGVSNLNEPALPDPSWVRFVIRAWRLLRLTVRLQQPKRLTAQPTHLRRDLLSEWLPLHRICKVQVCHPPTRPQAPL